MRHGADINPPNRFSRQQIEYDHGAEVNHAEVAVEYIEDDSQSIVTSNDSPDLPFRYSLNPYRGCVHGCSYCYARPTHEYLGFSAGVDFETKVIVKKNAPRLFRDFLSKKTWRCEPIAFSGVTDCYQPIERRLRLTRGCLEIAATCKQPISIVTKNALVTRDLDLLSQMAKDDLIHVSVSLTTLDSSLAGQMEPKTSVPEARLRTISELAGVGVPVGVMVAPVIPGLNDSEIPAILSAANRAGATVASYVLLRLPLSVQTVFQDWLEKKMPDSADRIMSRIASTRGGKSNDSTFGQRMVGSGQIADQIRDVFRLFRGQLQLNSSFSAHRCDLFEPPADPSGQMTLF